jgi:alanyl-tRNA synthetase
MESLKEKEAELHRVQIHLALQKREELLQARKIVEGMEVIAGRVDFMGPRELRSLTDLLRDRMRQGAVVLAAPIDDRVHWIVGTSGSGRGVIHAGVLVNEVARITGGKGGGRPDLAEGSGKDPGKIDEALEAVSEIIRKLLAGEK